MSLVVSSPAVRAAEDEPAGSVVVRDVADGRAHWRSPLRARVPDTPPDGRADWADPPIGRAVPEATPPARGTSRRLDVTVDGSLRTVPRRPLPPALAESVDAVDRAEAPVDDGAALSPIDAVAPDPVAPAVPARPPSEPPFPSRARLDALVLWSRTSDREAMARGVVCGDVRDPRARRGAAREGVSGDREAFERALRLHLDAMVSPSGTADDGVSREWTVLPLGCVDTGTSGRDDAPPAGDEPGGERPAPPTAWPDDAAPDQPPVLEESPDGRAPPDSDDLFFVGDDVPAGFEALAAPQEVLVDLWFNGRRRGTVAAVATPEEIVFERPLEVLALLGEDVVDPDALVEPLALPLPTNADRLCFADGDPPGCGTIEADPLAVIYDESRLRADLFVAGALQRVSEREASRYLADPNRRGASILTLRTSASSLAGQEDGVDTSGRLLSGYGRGNVSIAASHGSRTGEARLHELKLTHHARGHEFTAGTYEWVPGGAWTGIDVVGAGFSTSFRTRLDLESAFGSELVVFLPRRAVVQIIVEGRVLDGASYPPGNHVLDTTALPEGTYPIELRIVENDGSTRSEFRTFSRSVRIPPPGEPVFGATAGIVRPEDELLPESGGTVLAGFTLSNRIADRAAWQLGMLQLGEQGFGQGELIYLGERLSVQAAGTVGRESTLGTDVRLALQSPAARFGFSHRRFASDIDTASDAALARLYPARGTRWDVSATRTIGRYALRASAGRSRVTEEGGAARNLERYDIGIGRSLSFGRGLRGSVQGAFSRVGDEELLSLRTSLFFGRGSIGGSVQADALRLAGGDVELGLGVDVDHEGRVAEALWGAGAYARVGADRSAGADVWIDHPLYDASLSSDVARTGDANGARANTVATASTQIGLDARGAAVGGNLAAESGVIVAIDGEPAGEPFDIVVNGVRVSGGTIGTTRFVGLQPFESYLIKLIPEGLSSNGFGADVYEVTLYPGSVERIAFTAVRQVLVVAELVDEDGEPLGNAVIRTPDGPIVTDDFGYLQADLAPGTSIGIVRADGRLCAVDVPDTSPGEALLVLDAPLTCRVVEGEPFAPGGGD